MRRRFLTPLLLLGVASLWSSGAAADPPNADRGRALYENHCEFCHTSQVHSRPNKLPLTRNELRGIVNDWRRQQNLRWSEDDTEDVVEFLDRTRYHFAPQTQ